MPSPIFCRALQLMIMDHHARFACGRFSRYQSFHIFFFFWGVLPLPWRQQSNLFSWGIPCLLMVMHQHMKFTCERFSTSFRKSKIHRQYLLPNLWNVVVGKGGKGWSWGGGGGGGGGGSIRCSGMQLPTKRLREKQQQQKHERTVLIKSEPQWTEEQYFVSYLLHSINKQKKNGWRPETQ